MRHVDSRLSPVVVLTKGSKKGRDCPSVAIAALGRLFCDESAFACL
jgi:hypothetical protein